MNTVLKHLEQADAGQIRLQAPMSEYTTWKIGGPADLLFIPDGVQGLIAAIRIFREQGIPWMQLGRGSNMLVSDKGIRGAVIKLADDFDYVRYEDDRIVVGAAYSFIKLSIMAGKHGLSGLEFAGGIPGSVGGAVYMNAGAHGSDVSQILQSAEVVTETGELVHWQNEDFQYAYRHSALQGKNDIVTEVVFQLAHGDRKEIAAAMASFKERRLKTQPLKLAVAGSVFRNPQGHHAAKLIEEAGLKGLRVGDAEVSTMHANFIINTGKATAEDVLTLMEQIQRTVEDRFQVKLRPEVLIKGER